MTHCYFKNSYIAFLDYMNFFELYEFIGKKLGFSAKIYQYLLSHNNNLELFLFLITSKRLAQMGSSLLWTMFYYIYIYIPSIFLSVSSLIVMHSAVDTDRAEIHTDQF